MKQTLFVILAVAIVSFPCLAHGEIGTISLEVSPGLDTYMPGQKINSVEATISDTEGLPVSGLNLTGVLKALHSKQLLFRQIAEGVYHADVDYSVTSGDLHLIEVEVAITGPQSLTKSTYIITTAMEQLKLYINSPQDGALVAPGQEIAFEAEVRAVSQAASADNVGVWVIDIASGQRTRLDKSGEVYSTEVVIPKSAGASLDFIVLATASDGGRDAAEALKLENKPVLYVETNNAEQNIAAGRVAFNVRYFDKSGPVVTHPRLNANITSYPSGAVRTIELTNENGVYIGEYVLPEGDSSADVAAWDDFGNKGDMSMSIASDSTKLQENREEMPWELMIIGLVVLVGASFVFAYFKPGKGKADAKGALKQLKAEKAELEETIKQTKLDFYKRRILSDVANKRITEAEEKLELVKKRIETADK